METNNIEFWAHLLELNGRGWDMHGDSHPVKSSGGSKEILMAEELPVIVGWIVYAYAYVYMFARM